jgi:hypothetical protein
MSREFWRGLAGLPYRKGTSQLGVYIIEKAHDELQGGVSGEQEMGEGVRITRRLLIVTSTKC